MKGRESCYGRKKRGCFAGGEGVKVGGEEDWYGHEDVEKEYGGDSVSGWRKGLGGPKRLERPKEKEVWRS